MKGLARPAPSGTANLWSRSSFLQVKSDGTLWTWIWNGSAYAPSLVMSGWGSTTHVAGLRENDFLEIKGGNLREWIYDTSQGWGYFDVESGWNNTRLLTGQSGEHFMQIRTDGTLWTWTFVDPGDGNWYYSPKFEMGGWGQSKVIAGLVDGHFLEIKGEELVDWKDAGDGTGYQRTHLDWGWSNARLIAGVSATRFVTVRTAPCGITSTTGTSGRAPRLTPDGATPACSVRNRLAWPGSGTPARTPAARSGRQRRRPW